MGHDHAKRYHRGLDNQLNRIWLTQNVSVSIGIVRSRQRYGGILNIYFREVAREASVDILDGARLDVHITVFYES